MILAPEYGSRLAAEPPDRLAARLARMPVWIRHDEHVHVDLDVGR